jgi:hypothetical protein
MQTSGHSDSRTRDDTKVHNNTLPTNEVSNPNAIDEEKTDNNKVAPGNSSGVLVNKRDRIKTMQVEERPNKENLEQNNE